MKRQRKPIIAGVIAGLVVASVGLTLFSLLLSEDTVTPEANSSVESIVENPPEPAEIVEPVALPFGGRTVLPEYRFVALYGSPVYSGLGVLGQQDVQASITRAKTLAAEYQPYSSETVIPTFEIIVTVASAGPTENQDYSEAIDTANIQPWVDAAKEAGIYVMLDLQPGRATFLEQAKLYEYLLLEPHVGLALDPEWRLLTPEARHLRTVGSVSAEEINATSTWLADLVKANDLPQKLFMIHQFKESMIINREAITTARPELGFVLHMDGFGTLQEKQGTWNKLLVDMPNNMFMGWKNFYDEDKPTPTPQLTMQQTPKPVFISYQ